jgi:hypothetical protein
MQHLFTLVNKNLIFQDYAGNVMDDFLGMFGLDKLDEDEKEKLSVSDKFSSGE